MWLCEGAQPRGLFDYVYKNDYGMVIVLYKALYFIVIMFECGVIRAVIIFM